MSKTAKHTPTPWHVGSAVKGFSVICTGPGTLVATTETAADAHRIALCANALADVPNETLQGNLLDEIRECLELASESAKLRGVDRLRLEDFAQEILAKLRPAPTATESETARAK
jgi:hypothetical protein